MALETTVEQVSGRVPITIVALDGELDASNFTALIDTVRGPLRRGQPALLLDLTNLRFMASSGLVALHSIVRLMHGEPPPDPEAGWDALHSLGQDVAEGSTQTEVQLCGAQPAVERVLARTGTDSPLRDPPGSGDGDRGVLIRSRSSSDGWTTLGTLEASRLDAILAPFRGTRRGQRQPGGPRRRPDRRRPLPEAGPQDIAATSDPVAPSSRGSSPGPGDRARDHAAIGAPGRRARDARSRRPRASAADRLASARTAGRSGSPPRRRARPWPSPPAQLRRDRSS